MQRVSLFVLNKKGRYAVSKTSYVKFPYFSDLAARRKLLRQGFTTMKYSLLSSYLWTVSSSGCWLFLILSCRVLEPCVFSSGSGVSCMHSNCWSGCQKAWRAAAVHFTTYFHDNIGPPTLCLHLCTSYVTQSSFKGVNTWLCGAADSLSHHSK